jgi:hypothetical protein
LTDGCDSPRNTNQKIFFPWQQGQNSNLYT